MLVYMVVLYDAVILYIANLCRMHLAYLISEYFCAFDPQQTLTRNKWSWGQEDCSFQQPQVDSRLETALKIQSQRTDMYESLSVIITWEKSIISRRHTHCLEKRTITDHK